MKNSKLLPILVLFLSSSVFGQDKLKVVYHVTDAEKVPFVLGNIENHIKGVGGPDNVEIILVAHGPAVKAFEKKEAVPTVLSRIRTLNKSGVEFDACGNMGCTRFGRHGLKRIAPPRTVPDSRSPVLNVGV